MYGMQHVLAIATLDELLADGRNGWLLRERHHGLKTARLIEIPRDFLPASVESFAEEYWLEGALDRDFGEREAAA